MGSTFRMSRISGSYVPMGRGGTPPHNRATVGFPASEHAGHMTVVPFIHGGF